MNELIKFTTNERMIAKNIKELKSMTLIKGDCLDVMNNISDKSIDMILCDLPYGKTACKWDAVIPFDKLWECYNRIIKDNGAIILFGSEPFSSYLRMSNLKIYRYDWIWDKQKGTDFLNARRKPLSSFEIISVFYKKKPTYNPQWWYSTPYDKGAIHKKNTECYRKSNPHSSKSIDGKRYPLNVIKIGNAANSKKIHPTQKPVELLEYLIKTYTEEEETVLDNCMGSGSTGVACLNTNRKFIGIEKEEKYFEIAYNRIKEETFKKTSTNIDEI